MRVDQLEAYLTEGVEDLIAYGVTITPDRETRVVFSAPIQKDEKQIIVTGSEYASVASLVDLGGKEVYVNPLSTYSENLEKVNVSLRKVEKAPVIVKASSGATATGTIRDEEFCTQRIGTFLHPGEEVRRVAPKEQRFWLAELFRSRHASPVSRNSASSSWSHRTRSRSACSRPTASGRALRDALLPRNPVHHLLTFRQRQELLHNLRLLPFFCLFGFSSTSLQNDRKHGEEASHSDQHDSDHRRSLVSTGAQSSCSGRNCAPAGGGADRLRRLLSRNRKSVQIRFLRKFALPARESDRSQATPPAPRIQATRRGTLEALSCMD